MNRIVINESDLTTNNVALSEPDIAYVPGFAIPNAGVVERYVPTLCSTIEQFEKAFGSTPPVFTTDQYYPGSPESGMSAGVGFPRRAIPGYRLSNGLDDSMTEDDPDATFESNIWFMTGEPDPSYIYAKELISRGVQVIYERVNTSSEISVNEMYEQLTQHVFNKAQTWLTEKGEFSIKYITSGGYPTYECMSVPYEDENGNMVASQHLADMMMNIAATRGDAIALIDHTDNPERSLTSKESVFYCINNVQRLVGVNDSYGAMFTPHATFQLVQSYRVGTTYILPGSFAYLSALGTMLLSYNSWLPVAGVTRGAVPGIQSLHTNYLMTNSVADSFQYELGEEDAGVSINPITRVRPYGLCIWGNRTLHDQSSSTTVASNYLNIRNMLSDVKKSVYTAARALMFEQNTDILWTNFKGAITPLLDSMITGYGLSSYKILKGSTSNRTKLSAVIKLTPVYSVESFEVSIQLLDDDSVTVE